MKLEFNYQTEAITLPGAVVGKMATASENDLKLLLLLASRRELCCPFDPAAAAEQLQISEKEVELSVAFWRGAGILKGTKGGKLPRRRSEDAADGQTENEGSLKEQTGGQSRKMLPFAVKPTDLPAYTGTEVEVLVNEFGLDPLLRECQALLSKVFNVSESKKIIALSDTLHLSDTYILLLCSYCVSLGKGSVAYVTATACELYNAGITSEDALEQYISEREKYHDFENRMRHLIGLGSRRLTAKEKRFFENWEGMAFPFEVIAFAYEVSVNATGDFSPAHLNAVLEGFKKAGVKTKEDAEKQSATHAEEMKKQYAAGGKQAEKPEKKSDFVSFDSEDFFKAARQKSLDKLKNN
ncbi:MAG: DnaD domain protein [Clostridia bacterium]|nr:DnaD domain protein [Clostridia bacterium]